ncbi:MAG: ABC transporter permease [Coriobacteriia bacterium]|nr:ABC transporter permease [Coriobacteriia bacterium]MCL2745659.1 ABC transporter permease [Coriobacteriia bacterium]MCL2871328.1 ABC transporter permease [Coriobacteriia bacterium]
MNFAESFRIALKALSANRARALLTMLGVIIGVMSVILLVSIGTGVSDDITGQLEGLGTNVIYVMPMSEDDLGMGMMMPSRQFTIDDVNAVETRLGGIATVTPMVETMTRFSVGNNEMMGGVTGMSAAAIDVFDVSLDRGRMYSSSEVLSGARVAIIGAEVDRLMFANHDSIGQEIVVDDQRFTVIGVTELQGGGAITGGGLDNAVMMPFTSAQRVTGSQDVNMIAVKTYDVEDMDHAQSLIRQALLPRMGTDFSSMTQDEVTDMMGAMVAVLTFMLGGIASISLLVGGIGIMNIMLVSVSERTREIGIRKAIGAKTYDIMSQFVIESVLLSVLGGLIGIALGALGSWGIAASGALPSVVSIWSVALAFFFSISVGVFFGVYPAWRASKLDPIDALRFE